MRRVPVRALVEFILRSGDLGRGFSGPNRAVEAIRVHREIQKSRPGGYKAEVPVKGLVESENLVLELSGRIDGVWLREEGTVIEEIKTVVRDLERAVEKEDPVHWGQARIYACLYAEEHDLDRVEVRLTYCLLDADEAKTSSRSYSIDELRAFLGEVAAKYTAWLEVVEAHRAARDQSVKDLEFPFQEYRAGQRDMAVAVYRTIRDAGQLFAQAPTGLGKTMAAIFPALKALAEGHTDRVYFLTARTTGQAAAQDALINLIAKGAELKVVRLTARDKICVNLEAECSPDRCARARGHFDRLNQALAEAFNNCDPGRESIIKAAEVWQVCPFELALELALWADVVIGDFNYAFHPRVGLRRHLLNGPGTSVFLIDEAHNLVERGREMFSAVIRKKPFLDMRRIKDPDFAGVSRAAAAVDKGLLAIRKRLEENRRPLAEKEDPQELYPLLANFQAAAEAWMAQGRDAPQGRDLMELYFETVGFLKIAEDYDSNYATLSERNGSDCQVRLFCLHPAEQLRETLKKCRAAVFFSATLSPLEYFRDVLGGEETAGLMELRSPFPEENFCPLVVTSISTLYRNREATRERAARAVADLIATKKGNYLVFFPSYEYLSMVYESFAWLAPDVRCLVQDRAMNEEDREEFLGEFTADSEETMVGFAVMGGIFGESIDLVGDRLTGAAIFGVGLPAICLEREVIREHYQERNEAGFEYAYLYPGLNRVCQAAGRVIRTGTDRGTVLLIDSRFGAPAYESLLPKHWRIQKTGRGNELKELLQAFWSNRGCLQ